MLNSGSSSPLLQVPQDDLPRWVKQRLYTKARRPTGLVSPARLKITAVACFCVVFGFLLTTSLADADSIVSGSSLMQSGTQDGGSLSYVEQAISTPSDQSDRVAALGSFHSSGATVGHNANILEATSEGQVYPSGSSSLRAALRPVGEGSGGHSHGHGHGQRPSLSGALSRIHDAVSDRLSSIRHDTPATGAAASNNVTRPGIFTDVDSHDVSSDATLGLSAVSDTLIPPGRDLLGERSRIGKVTIIFGGAATYERAVRTHEAHDRIHGYPLHVLRHGIMDDVWSKPAYLLSILLRELSKPEDERLQWLLWVDADTILLNPYVPIETFLPPSPEFDDVHLLITNDWNGLNNGVFPVRVNQWAVDLFAAIVSFRFYRPDTPLVFRDQSAMDTLIKETRFAKHIVQAPQRWFNAYQGEHNETLAPYQVRRGDFLVHFAGVGDRDSRMAYWLDRVEQHLPDWEMKVQHTSYPSEARDFWSGIRDARSDAGRRLAAAQTTAREEIAKTSKLMGEYRERLQDGEANIVMDRIKRVQDVLEGQGPDVQSLNDVVRQLEEARRPLYLVSSTATKALNKQAHEAVFAAEKAIFGSTEELRSSTEFVQLEGKMKHLKDLLVQSEWSRADMLGAIETLNEARMVLEQKNMTDATVTVSAVPVTDKGNTIGVAHEEEQRVQAGSTKSELLGDLAGAAEASSPVPAIDLEPTVLAVVLTHTGTVYAQETHIVVAQETVTAVAEA